jgi:hypothetical protein
MNEVFARDPSAVAVIESALIFEVVRDARARGEKDGALADWRRRIDRIIVVTAPDELKIKRYAARIQASVAGGGSLKPSRPMRATASRTRFRMPKRPRRPIMCLIIRAILKRYALRLSGALAASANREQQIRPITVTTIRRVVGLYRGRGPGTTEVPPHAMPAYAMVSGMFSGN